MPASTAATVNQFPNPKVSDGERKREREGGVIGKAKGAICYSSLEWISPPLPLYLCRSLSSLPFKPLFSHFTTLHPSLLPLAPPPCHRILGPFQGILEAAGEGCHFKMSPPPPPSNPAKQAPSHDCIPPFHCQAHLLVSALACVAPLRGPLPAPVTSPARERAL